MNRIDIINALIQNFDYKKYLEIGVQKGISLNGVKCDYKVGVDPDPKAEATLVMSSDEFFQKNEYWDEKFDIIFIDGLHHAEQVYKDIINSAKILNKGGTIVVHDLNPTSYEMQAVPRIQKEWTGDGWRAWMKLRNNLALDMMVVDTDYGCGIIQIPEKLSTIPKIDIKEDITYEEFSSCKEGLLNLISINEFKKWLELTKK